MHHKRKRPKNSRAGCLLCKPWKANRIKGTGDARPMQERRADLALREGVGEVTAER